MATLLTILLLFGQPDSTNCQKQIKQYCQIKDTNAKLDSILKKLKKIEVKQKNDKKDEQQIFKSRKK